jgi:hypothetical protein
MENPLTAIKCRCGDPICKSYFLSWAGCEGRYDLETANQIVRAVNDHDALVAALADLLEWETQQGGYEARAWDSARRLMGAIRAQDEPAPHPDVIFEKLARERGWDQGGPLIFNTKRFASWKEAHDYEPDNDTSISDESPNCYDTWRECAEFEGFATAEPSDADGDG